MANIGETTRFNNPALAAFAQKMAQARGINTAQTPAVQPQPLLNTEPAAKDNIATPPIANMTATNIVEETNQKPEGTFVRKGMFLDIRV